MIRPYPPERARHHEGVPEPRIEQLLASPVHRFEGRPEDGASPAPPGEVVDVVEIRAGLGIVGDRYFGHRAHREAAITVIAREGLPAGVGLAQVRRNILLSGVDVDTLVGKVLTIDSGDGPVVLEVRRPANPCAWLDVTVGPGTRKALRGKGGVRCVPLTDGLLRVGPIQVSVSDRP
jgi:MOSC domain-containing protein YiiM